MIDFNSEGPTSMAFGELGQPVDLSQADDIHSYVLAIARRDTDQQIKAKLENNQSVINYGLHTTYRSWGADPVDFFTSPFVGEGGDPGTNYGYVSRKGSWMLIPDLWFRYEQKLFRIEAEVAARVGYISSIAQTGAENGDPRSLDILSFGAVIQSEFRPMPRLKAGLELGFASGDRAYGMGLSAGRTGSGPDGATAPGDIDGRQWNCPSTGSCTDRDITNFTFNRDYRPDLILWRELYRYITDAFYAKPWISYEVAEGLTIFGSAIYSRAVFANSTPSSGTTPGTTTGGPDVNLGTEFDGGAQYETDDGFFASFRAGILFPFGGFNNTALAVTGAPPQLESATVFRLNLGVKF
jgi:uncharacterized protein (TIGR04551 family)